MRTATRRDVVDSTLVWVRRGEKVRRITLELKREARISGRELHPMVDVTPFLDRDEPPLHLFMTSAGVIELSPPEG